jgi:uncharacterized membrane protein
MFPQTAAQWHAALNDFPSLLFALALVFDLAGDVTKRESLRTTAFWTLMAGAAGALLALGSGLVAEKTIEHGGMVHLVMERHETMAISVTVLFVLLAGWRLWRRGQMRSAERPVYLMISTVGVLAVLWTAHLGGSIVYEYGGGVPTSVLEGALQERAVGHSHGEGEEHDHAAPTAAPADSAQGDHTHAPGTPEHEHD